MTNDAIHSITEIVLALTVLINTLSLWTLRREIQRDRWR